MSSAAWVTDGALLGAEGIEVVVPEALGLAVLLVGLADVHEEDALAGWPRPAMRRKAQPLPSSGVDDEGHAELLDMAMIEVMDADGARRGVV